MKIITLVAFLIGGSSFVLSYVISKSGLLNSFIFLIGMIVANVPAGLAVTVTLCLVLTAKRMASRNCLVKTLDSIETLGSTTVIFSDKIGTLTQNKMTVSHLWYNKQLQEFKSLEVLSSDNVNEISLTEEYLYTVSSLCNRSYFKENQDFSVPMKDFVVFGNATDCAILSYAQVKYGSVENMRSKFKKIYEIPFNSQNKFQLSVYEHKTTGEYYLCLKGAPERILKLCNKIMVDNSSKNIDNEDDQKFKEVYTYMGNQGERVIATAIQIMTKEDYEYFDTKKINVNVY